MTTKKLSVLVGVTLTDAMLTSSTAAEPGTGETVWAAATNYALGTRVYRAGTHRRYENLIAGVDAGLPEDTPLRWYDLGATNRWAMLDGDSSTQTVTASPATIVLAPGHINAISLRGTEADTVAVTVKDAPAGTTLFSNTFTLESSAPDDYYEHFFEGFRPKYTVLVTGLEPYSAAEVTIVLTSSTGTVKCSVLQVGDLREYGDTLINPVAKPKSYSRVKIDENGDNKIDRGKKARDMTASALVPIEDASYVLQSVTDLLDVPCLVICTETEDFDGLQAYGLLSGEMTYNSQTHVSLNLSVIGLV